MARTVWTPLMDEYLLTKRMKGESFASIAAFLGVPRRSVPARFKRRYPNVVGPIGVRRVKSHSVETKAAVVRMKLAGKPLKVIAAELGLNINQVHGIWWQWNNFLFLRRAA